jgi:hypothetical protein
MAKAIGEPETSGALHRVRGPQGPGDAIYDVANELAHIGLMPNGLDDRIEPLQAELARIEVGKEVP